MQLPTFTMPHLHPRLTVLISKDLYNDLLKVSTDFWILEGAFAKDALFITASVDIHSEDFPDMDKAAMKLIKSLTEKEGTDPPINFSDSDFHLYNHLNLALLAKKKALTELRIKLEGPTWYNYDPEVEYQIIGNQPNAGQKGSAAPKRRKSTRTTKASKFTGSSMVSAGPSNSKKDDAAEGLVALARPNTRDKSLKAAPSSDSFTPSVSSPLAAGPSSASPIAVPVSLNPKDKEIAQCKWSLEF
jgi:hypothetical protein